MKYEWDNSKRLNNIKKHGVDFVDATPVFDDARAITIEDDHTEEQRWVTIGMDAAGYVLVVIYTHRDDNIRIISARKANSIERNFYEKAL